MASRSKPRSGSNGGGKESSSSTQEQMDVDDRDYSIPAIQYHDVTAAAYRIRKGVKETPLEVREFT